MSVRYGLLVGFLVYLFLIQGFNAEIAGYRKTIDGLEGRLAAVEKHPDAVPLPSSEKVARYHQELAAARASVDAAQLRITVVNCFAMWLLIGLGLWPFARHHIDRGIETVTLGQRQAERRLEDARAELEEVQARLGRLDDDAAALREREIAAGESEAASLRELAANEARQIAEHAEQGIHRESELAEQRVLAALAERAVEQALEDVRADVDEATRKRLNRQLIEGYCA